MLPHRSSVVVALIVAVIARFAVGVLTIDDAFITFRYSRHIAEGLGFTFNPPVPVLGTSTPLYALILALPARLGIDLEWSAFAVSLVCDLASVWLVFGLLRDLGYRMAPLLAAVAINLAPSIVVYSVSGMETSLYVLLIIASYAAFERHRWWGIGVLGGLATLCRPDGALVAAILAVGVWWTLPWRRALGACMVMAMLIAPWVMFAWAYFGSPIPMSVLAKADMVQDPLAGFRVVRAVFFNGGTLWLTVTAATGVVLMWRTAHVGVRLWITWGVGYATAFTVTGAFDNYLWYFTPLMPLYLAGVAVVLDGLLHRVRAMAPDRWATAAMRIGSVLLVLVTGAVNAARLRADATAIRASQPIRERIYQSWATALAEAPGRDPACAIASQEIGVLGYYFRGPIVDIAGLVSPEFIGRSRDEALRASPACWMVTYDENLRALAPTLLDAEWFAREFSLVQRIEVSPTRAMVVYARVSPRPVLPVPLPMFR